jgi:hypothetical protein
MEMSVGCGYDSAVDIVTRLQVGQARKRGSVGDTDKRIVFRNVQTGPGARSDSN